MDISEYKGVLVFAERRAGTIQKIAYELLGIGRTIADALGQPLAALVVGSGIKDAEAADLIASGADEVVVADAPELAAYVTEPYAKVLTQAIRERKPGVVFVGATTIGRDLAPRVSARVHTGLTADCTGLAVEDATNNLLMTRPAFGGNIMATIVCPEHRPQMSTVRPGVMRRLDKDPSRKGEVSRLDVKIEKADLNVEILEAVVEKAARKNIEEASVLVSGGRGLGSPENYAKLSPLAEELGGLVSASRAVVDAGWAAPDRQVGQTGKTVRPDLYLALGISGMIQHIAGMEDSDYIVAVNKNPDAPIFEFADVGIVTDANKLVPALVEELRTAKLER
ncbi:MAG TPA: electron transfer flavoprotein subunit alpha/FixB family protein [Spirochaetales bacterium]|nr:electron transfer flavoprotein subunit alpha/FixB family protein [Spirochaetales bacterium]HRY55717.1 electron transfer flavoprotein subunit alpha/FixB family protein [Spirochaetia bacterium]HRZ65822.1 electron transfer flavoprotein subunit alpha/FixB family protein [Spirochaetia bacterium]